MGEHKKEGLLIRILKRLGIIGEVEISKEDMCKQVQGMCHHNCEHCAWGREEPRWLKEL